MILLSVLLAFSACFANGYAQVDDMGNELQEDPEMVLISRGSHQENTIMHHTNNMAFKKAVQKQNQASRPVKKSISLASPYNPHRSRSRTKRQSNVSLPSVCTTKDAIFRNITGFCNNEEHEEWGSFFSATIRFFEPSYDDEKDAPRIRGVKGLVLPGSRLVSLGVHETTKKSSANYTHYLMQWGQFLAHDITLTPVSVDPEGQLLDCDACPNSRDWTGRCTRERSPNPDTRSRFCANLNCQPIPIPQNDPIYPNRNCMEFTRSLAAQLDGPREQLNELTVYIDASNVYGSDPDTASALRTHSRGELKVTKMGTPTSYQTFLPQLRDNVGCESKRDKKCFMAGDTRNTIQVGLTAMHTMWLREHNRIAQKLASINPRWRDERIYQEARRIVGALMQQITYEEYLPKIVGPKVMAEFNLFSGRAGGQGYNKDMFYEGYNPACDATTTNVFSTAAFRFGHSLLDGNLKFYNGSATQVHDMGDNWFNPDIMYARKGNIDRVFKGMTTQPCQGLDRFYHESVRDKLFGNIDLAATNIQRGRDHGIQPWLKYRELFSQDPETEMPRTWLDLVKVVGMDIQTAISLYSVYQQGAESIKDPENNSLQDIDAYSGFLAEPPVEGGIIGITSARIVADQFIRLKDCDRFFYENGRKISSFTKAQLTEIRKVKLSHLICRHFDPKIMKTVQEDIFTMAGSGNAEQACSKYIMKQMDLTKWKS